MFEIAVAIIAIMISVGGIIYGFGYAMDNRRIKEFGLKELTQSFINGVILFILFAAFSQVGIVTQIINQFVGALPNNVLEFCGPIAYNYGLCLSYYYLVGIQPFSVGNTILIPLSIQIINILSYLISAYLIVGTLSTIGLSVIFISIKFTAFSIFLGPLKLAIETLSTTLIALFLQAAIINAIGIIIPLLLYIGLTLRTFYFSRRLGGAILALAIGLFVVFPLTYLMNIEIMNSIPALPSGALQSSMLNFTSSAMTFSFAIASKALPLSIISNSISNNEMGLIMLKSAVSGTENLAGSFEYIIKLLMNIIANFILEVIILPLLSIILTIISIRELARILGSEISFGRFDIF